MDHILINRKEDRRIHVKIKKAKLNVTVVDEFCMTYPCSREIIGHDLLKPSLLHKGIQDSVDKSVCECVVLNV